MRAIIVEDFGSPDVLRLGDKERPEPEPGQVLVRLHAVGVNFSETERRRGIYAPPPMPWTPGSEGAGVVERVGEGVDPALVGRRVAFWAMPPAVSGTYAEYAVAPANSLFMLPETLDFERAAALPLQGLTAYGVARFAAQVRAGQTVLVHAAGGGTGLLVLQLARIAGARVLGTVSTEAKAEAVREMGGEPFLYGDDLARRVIDATEGRGVDVVLDSVGLATQEASLEVLAPYGHLVFYGEASGAPLPIDVDRLYYRCLKVSAFGMYLSDPEEQWQAARRDLLDGVATGALRLTISRVLPLEQAAEAHRLLESRQAVGKIVLAVGSQ
jgi:NADPH2:quinone reductase